MTTSAPVATISRERLFAEWLAKQPAQAFDWRAANCCHFAAAWVAFAEGADPMAPLPATATGAAALRLVRKLGGMQSAWTAQLGRDPLISPLLAQVGDVVLAPAEGETGWMVGICAGANFAVRDADGNCLFAPLSSAAAAWRISPRACA
jgi:hypothetical protein